MNQQEIGPQTPLTVITGFLGSGKTTLISKILPKRGMENCAVIVNDIGEIVLDSFLVTKPKEDMILLANGCLCCSVRGELVDTLNELLIDRARGECPPFDRVLVETTGLADPVPVMLSVTSDDDLSKYFCVDGVITVIDAVNADSQLDEYQESKKQVAVADRLLISKADLTSKSGVDELKIRLQDINPGAQIIEVYEGEIELELLFDVHPQAKIDDITRVDNWLQFNNHQNSGKHTHAGANKGDSAPHSHHDNEIQSFALYYDLPISTAGFMLWSEMLGQFKGPHLLRMKGLMNVEGKPVVVHAVQHLFHSPVTLSEWPTDDVRSQFVFITRGISVDELRRTFEAFKFTSNADEAGPTFDQQGYEKFLDAMNSFSIR